MALKRKTRRRRSATEMLRQAITESGLSFIELERRSGVKRQSLMKFARGEQSLSLMIRPAGDKLEATLSLATTGG